MGYYYYFCGKFGIKSSFLARILRNDYKTPQNNR